MRRLLVPLLVTCVAVGVAAGAAQRDVDRDFGQSADAWCDDGWDERRARHCEVREETIGGGNPLDVDAGPNGGISIRGWNGSDVHIRAKITTHADSREEARTLAAGVRLETGGGQIRAVGPDSNDGRFSVSFEIQVPRHGQLTLNTQNGGISIHDFRGSAKFRARNGGVSLGDVGGDIRGETTNGGLNVDLTGDRWDGQGLDIETHNGGVRLRVPANYSAELETGTTNGGFRIDFPITVQGRIGRRLETTLGAGGAKIRAITTNGGVTITRR
jgi:hypothetical protein